MKEKTIIWTEKSKNFFAGIRKGSTLHLSLNDQIFFIKRLSFLTKAGIPISESLHMIREQTNTSRYSKILDVVLQDIANGQFLSTSLKKFRNAFGDFTINIISVGESSGILSENLEYLGDELKKKQALRRKVVGAFVYPIVVTLATFGITAFLMVYLFPKIMPIFSSLHMELPLTTRIILYISNTLRADGLFILLGLVALVVGLFLLVKKNVAVHYYFDKYTLKIPIVGKLLQFYNLTNLTRTLGLLLRSGITVSESLHLMVSITPNLVYKKHYENLLESILRGEKMAQYFAKNRNVFGDVIGQIVSVGERSGNLANSLLYLSEMFENEVDDFTKNLSSMIEPVLMIFMGIIVGFVAVSIITPIYGITQHLQPK